MEFNNSVIFSAYRRNLFFKNKIFFKKGIHEDIVIIFKLYFFSKKIINLNDTLYIKINKKNSISRNFSKIHNCSFKNDSKNESWSKRRFNGTNQTIL